MNNPAPHDARVMSAEQIAELDKRVSAAEFEVLRQLGSARIKSGEAMKLIEFHAIDYLRRCLVTIKALSRVPSEEAVWIKWPGGDCPVPVETFVEAEFRNAQIDSDVARRFIWDHTDSRFDIVAFRITRAPGAGT